MENASVIYDYKKVKQMINRQTERYGWEFIFLGANIDAAETARTYGIDADHAVDYVPDACGTDVIYETMNNAIRNTRCGMPLAADHSWRKAADRDFQKRKK